MQLESFCMYAIREKYKFASNHKYLRYYNDSDGLRVAEFCNRHNADLQSCVIKNNKAQIDVLRYIMIDLDAKNADDAWLDDENALDWSKVFSSLNHYIPSISKHIEYATKSYSKKGIHLVFGFTALPLLDSSVKMQNLCYKIQHNLIEIFNEMKLGADTGARGLRRFFSTFRNKENVLHQHKLLTKRIEKSDTERKDKSKRIPYLLNLFRDTEEAKKKLGIDKVYRLYSHATLELKIANLYLYMMGQRNVTKFKKPEAFESVILTYDQLYDISGIKKRSISESKLFDNLKFKSLFNLEIKDKKTIEISAKRPWKYDEELINKRLERAKYLVFGDNKRNKCNPKIIRPEDVQVGQRNLAAWSWALQYKLAGYAQQEAIDKIKLRMKFVQFKNERDEELRESQIESVVRSMYRNHRQLIATRLNALPEFLEDDKIYAVKKITEKYRREPPPPGAEEVLRSKEVSFQKLQKKKKERVSKHRVFKQERKNLRKCISMTPRNTRNCGTPNSKIAVVKFDNKIGFFDNSNNLFLCLTKTKNYKLSDILFVFKDILQNTNIDLKNFWSPKRSNRNLSMYQVKIAQTTEVKSYTTLYRDKKKRKSCSQIMYESEMKILKSNKIIDKIKKTDGG